MAYELHAAHDDREEPQHYSLRTCQMMHDNLKACLYARKGIKLIKTTASVKHTSTTLHGGTRSSTEWNASTPLLIKTSLVMPFP